MLSALSSLPLAAALVVASSTPAPDTTEAPRFVIEGEHKGAAIDRLPLKASHADVRVAGVIAHVTVRQVWENAGDETIEANYVFPASTRAAVFGMRMRIGDRVLRAKIKEREAARKVYEAAKQEGKTASLLEQERANVFSMHVANILPGDRIEVELDYTELLVPRDKEYELVYPQVVGPRYAKGASAQEKWVHNPFLAEGKQAPWRFGVDVKIAAGVPVRDVYSPSHAIEPRFLADDELDLSIQGSAGSAGGAKDFVLRWRMVGNDVEAGVLLFRDKERGENFFLLMAQPPERVSDEQMPARELVFIVDVSGSMGGFPEETARALMKRLLTTLRPQDRFNVILFAGDSSMMSERSVPVTEETLAQATRFHGMRGAGGGTNLDAAVERALKLPTPDDTSRSFVLITDGYVGFENTVFDRVRDNLGRANMYAFGVGSSVNRLLIEGVAKAGLGEPFVVLDPASAPREVARFDKAISRPALTNVRVFYEGFNAYDVEPSVPADLLEDRPLVLYGKYRGPSTGRVRITGTAGDRRFERSIPVEDHLEKPAHEALRYLWARGRVAHLADVGTPDDKDIAEVKRLGLKYGLLTKWTSFVAVDYVVRNKGGSQRVIEQPQPLPEGVSEGALSPQQMFSSSTIIDFSSDVIEGELKSPDGAFLYVRKKMKTKSLIKMRSSFADKMQAGDLGALGGLGLRGSGAGGGGVAYGSGGLGLSGSGRGVARSQTLGGRGRAAAKVNTGKPLIMGSLSRSIIQRVMRENRTRLRYCYERELRRTPGLAGKVVVELVIGKLGNVTTVKIKQDSVKNPQLSRCLTRQISKLRFPAPAGGGEVRITYPLLFAPGK
jgi:Ca-activated chloride channel family protein